MTIREAERFYAQDKKKYEIKNNWEFLVWLDNSIENGYHRYRSLDELQGLIDNIVNWYEIKYPERELRFFEGERFLEFNDIRRISNAMTLEQLLFRLPERQLDVILSRYRACGWSQWPVYEDDKFIGYDSEIFLSIKRKEYSWSKMDRYTVAINDLSGEVYNNYYLSEFVDENEEIEIEELLDLFQEKFDDKFDYTELKECVYDHDCDLELRHRVLQLVALKLLYSENTIPERGYERAKRFINEFNKRLGLTLSTDEIDEIMSRDYTNGERWELVFKKSVSKSGEEFAYAVVEDVAKKEKEAENPSGIKKLIKVFSKK